MTMEGLTNDFSSLLLALLAMAFALWAAVVGWIGKLLAKKLDKIVDRLDEEASKLNEYIVQTESRLSVVEDRLEINHGS